MCFRDDDDINDVATMGGVNLSEESRNILATNAEYIGTQIRSCKDEAFLFHNPLLSRITAIGKEQFLLSSILQKHRKYINSKCIVI